MRFRVLRTSFPVLCACLLGAALICSGQQPDLDPFTKKLAPSVGSPENAIEKMLEAARLKPGETLYDLGCGDGRILVRAAKKYRVNAVGIEISRPLAEVAAQNVRKKGLENQVKIIHGDFMKTDLSAANVVTLYLAPTANETLRPNLERELRPKTRVVSYDYPIDGWIPMSTWETSGHLGDVHTIYLYEVPNSIKK
ncbi:MAG: class I SAM-dependent methyltransferase [Acidobacteriota bacterium]|nr:class I SAM-dependent methyltransferase [Acidobacteriota bacterium]